ncbi:MAG: tetratricopeptide repeat protein, partial [Planctomycetaceae bacterium]|nr:tetratricopeptide repeat protein [Planctomycetaceae bacterium]
MSSAQTVTTTIPEALNHAVALHRAGRLAEAEHVYRRILEVDPSHADAIQLLGVIANQVGRHDIAVQYISTALQLNPNSAMYYNNLGEAYRALEQLPQAKACYQKSLELAPGYGDALNNLGIILQNEGLLAEAEYCYRECLKTQPEQVEALSNLGTVLQSNALLNEAEQVFLQALRLNPNHAATHNNLGRIFTDRGDYLAAERSIRRAVELKPDLWLAYENLAIMLRAQGKYDEAKQAFAVSLEKAPHDGLKIQAGILTPIIMDSREHIAETRARVERAVDELRQHALSVADPLEKIGVNLFYLPYHGYNDRDIQHKIADLYAHATPSLKYVAPHCQPGAARAKHDRIRVGFISKYFFEHSVGRHNAGIIANLDRSKFHVTVFHFPGSEDATTARICASADEAVKLSAKLETARDRIAQAELDVLVYTDIGMDPWTYFLAYSRLAPVQCVLPGHPVTTGIPNVDYYISQSGMEPPNAQEHYTERLVQFDNLPSYFVRPKLPEQRMAREYFKLSEQDHLYVVGQMLFKLHPDFDGVIQRVLRADPQGRVLVFEGFQQHWTSVLMNRMRRTIPDVVDRVQVMPWLKIEEFVSLLACSDAVLDTFPFCGGTTSMQAFSVGAPIVTL